MLVGSFATGRDHKGDFCIYDFLDNFFWFTLNSIPGLPLHYSLVHANVSYERLPNHNFLFSNMLLRKKIIWGTAHLSICPSVSSSHCCANFPQNSHLGQISCFIQEFWNPSNLVFTSLPIFSYVTYWTAFNNHFWILLNEGWNDTLLAILFTLTLVSPTS